MADRVLLDPGWAAALEPVLPALAAVDSFLSAEITAGRNYLPASQEVLAAFSRPFQAVRVLIVGQDPYPTPGHAMGLSFSVRPDVHPLPRSLSNIFQELTEDLGGSSPSSGDLRPWADRGVLMLNRVLTVRPGEPGSHRAKGWEPITEQAIRALVAREQPLVAILWGRQAQSLAPILASVPTLCAAHPSPLSASRGFFGSRPFSRANALLAEQGAGPIDWTLP